jgi:parallel beta-helix repeat protein
MKKLVLLFLMSYVVSGGAAQAATYYVSRSGSDASSCAQAQSASTPKQTIKAGISCLAAGDTLFVRAGIYPEGLTGNGFPSGTSWWNTVRIANYPGETVWLQPSGSMNAVIWLDANIQYVEFDGINVDATNTRSMAVWFSTNNGNNPHHIRFQNAEVIAGVTGGGGAIMLGNHTTIGATGSHEILNVAIHGGGVSGSCGWMCASYGVYISGPNNRVENCDIYDTSGAAIQIYNSSGDPADNNIIRNNRLHDIRRSGEPTQVWGVIVAGNRNQIYNNLIYNVGVGDYGDGIFVYYGSGNQIYNNTTYNNRRSGINLYTNASGTEVKNNISYASGSNFFDGGTGTAQSNNLFGTNPNFVDPATNNFQLQAGSPAIDAGTSLPVVTIDFAGHVRPQGGAPDIGAYEYGQVQTPSPPSNLRILPD